MLFDRRQFGATAIGSVAALWGVPSLAQGAKVNLKVGGQFQAFAPVFQGHGSRLRRHQSAIRRQD